MARKIDNTQNSDSDHSAMKFDLVLTALSTGQTTVGKNVTLKAIKGILRGLGYTLTENIKDGTKVKGNHTSSKSTDKNVFNLNL